MDGHDIFTRTNELRRERNTEDTGRWSNRVFFTHVKAGAGTKKMVDMLHGWESRNLDLMSSRRAQRGMNLEWFRTNQIRRARQRLIEGGGENVESLVRQRIWNYKEKFLTRRETRRRTE